MAGLTTEPSVIVPIEYVYRNLICEFEHWDVCLVGLVNYFGKRCLCKVRDLLEDQIEYTLHEIDWDEECDDYLNDYRAAYPHWFYVDGKRQRDAMSEFGAIVRLGERWGSNPIVRKTV